MGPAGGARDRIQAPAEPVPPARRSRREGRTKRAEPKPAAQSQGRRPADQPGRRKGRGRRRATNDTHSTPPRQAERQARHQTPTSAERRPGSPGKTSKPGKTEGGRSATIRQNPNFVVSKAACPTFGQNLDWILSNRPKVVGVDPALRRRGPRTSAVDAHGIAYRHNPYSARRQHPTSRATRRTSRERAKQGRPRGEEARRRRIEGGGWGTAGRHSLTFGNISSDSS